MSNSVLEGENTIIRVIGIGGGGGNTINRMVSDKVPGAEFVAMNTDAQVLAKSQAPSKVQLGVNLTKGRGAGANPEIGRKAAEESLEEIIKTLQGAQMVFLTAGMGGGTGTGAISVVAKAAKELGILTIAIVTRPFSFEGRRKAGLAEDGIQQLMQYADSLIIIPNDRLHCVTKQKLTLMNAFAIADSVLEQGVASISSLIGTSAFINLDFNDVRSVMKDAGYAHMGVGTATGESKAIAAADAALHSPLLETDISGATGVVINITVSPDVGLDEVESAASHITDCVSDDANIIWGVSFDESMNDTMRITLVATGFDGKTAAPLLSQLKRDTVTTPNLSYSSPSSSRSNYSTAAEPTTYIPSPNHVAAPQPAPMKEPPAPAKQAKPAATRSEDTIPDWATKMSQASPAGAGDEWDSIEALFAKAGK